MSVETENLILGHAWRPLAFGIFLIGVGKVLSNFAAFLS